MPTLSNPSAGENLNNVRRVRLRMVKETEQGFVRETSRGSIRYRDLGGRILRDEVILTRIKSLAIPPAWVDVWICPHANGHIQATGRDARKRKQYRYHPQFRAIREEAKYSSLLDFGLALPLLRRQADRNLQRPDLDREKVLAAIVKLLDCTHLRVGNTEYLKTNKSQGLSTLYDGNVTIQGAKLRLRFRGKSGVWHEREVTDGRLARVVAECRDVPGRELFQYLDGLCVPRVIYSTDVNEYIRKATGQHTAKTFRTWAGTVTALSFLKNEPAPTSKATGARTIARVIKLVAAEMGNTPAVCRKSYVHPIVLESYLSGSLQRQPTARAGAQLSSNERTLLSLLETRLRRPRHSS